MKLGSLSVLVWLFSASCFAQNTPLVSAVLNLEFAKYETLLKQGENPNSLDRSNSSAWLMCTAARMSDTQYLELAIEYGGDVDLRHPNSGFGHSIPIACAISAGNVPGIDSLLAHGVDTEALICSRCDTALKAHIPQFAFFAQRVDIALKLYREVEFSQPVVDALIKVLEANNVRGEEQLRYQAMLIEELEADGYEINLRKK